MNNNFEKPRILILWSGTPDGGWSWPTMLVDNIINGTLNATIAWLITHYPNWWVARLWKKHKDLFETRVIEGFPVRREWEDFSKKQDAKIRRIYNREFVHFWWIDSIDFVILSGWMKILLWCPVEKGVNVHPSRVDKNFWWVWKYWDKAHKHAFEAFQRWKISKTAITMHFVDEEFDHWPVMAQREIDLRGCLSWQDAKARVVWETEHEFQLAVMQVLLLWKVALIDWKVVWDKDFQFDNPDYYKGEIIW